jgi:ABC-type glycerol-3-phosphate transport system substrate-binding protein
MNWFAFFPGLYKDENVGGDKIGFFVNPSQNVAASTLGGQGISVVAYSDKKDAALDYIKWFAQPDVQAKWWSLGGYSCHKSVLNDPAEAPARLRRRRPRHGQGSPRQADRGLDRGLRRRRQAIGHA